MIRIILESVGVSVALALIWFVYLPFFFKRYRQGGMNLLWSSIVVFLAAIIFNFGICTFNIEVIDVTYLFMYHVMSLFVCIFAIYAVTKTAKYTFDHTFIEYLRPTLFIMILFLIVSALGHGFRSLAWYLAIISRKDY